MSWKLTGAAVLLGATVGVFVSAPSLRGLGAQDRPEDAPADKRPVDGTPGSADKFLVDARLFVATDSDLTAATLFGRPAPAGAENFVAIGEVLAGHRGTVRLDGARFALFGRVTGEHKLGKKADALTLYLDDAATPDQRTALASILRSEGCLTATTDTPLSVAKISLLRPTSDPLSTVTAKLGDRGQFVLTPIKGANGRDPIAIVNAFTLFNERDAVMLATAVAEIEDHGRKLSTKSGLGEIHVVRLEGTSKD